MGLDSVLHVLIGGIITLTFYSREFKGILILIILSILAGAKELYDHFYTLGHCYPDCFPEHQSDFLFSLVFFFIFIIGLSITKKRISTKKLNYIISTLVILTIIVFIYKTYDDANKKVIPTIYREHCLATINK